ncbi:hypothetical protein QFW77_03575 [Luteimonas sp. RD2P54]|uniref:Lipoprotein n=1 Tax=Luteimonas endophytica TaxID=3042023 RepID=A0ABT6J5G6_9GAMM|nr:hypothetical protein [Luteimonas endophytica]MDH5822074.1 hypothetical protein [Luteimonas endophytica]
MSKHLVKAVVAVLSFGLITACAIVPPDTLVVREGLTAEQLDADGEVCLAEAKAAERGEPIAPTSTLNDDTAAQMAGSLSSGMAKGFGDMERFMAAHDACLARLGYRQVELTEEQRRHFAKLKDSDNRKAYMLEFSRKAIAEGK